MQGVLKAKPLLKVSIPVRCDCDCYFKHLQIISAGSDTMKKPVSQDYKSWRHGISLSGYLERQRFRQQRQVTVSSASLPTDTGSADIPFQLYS